MMTFPLPTPASLLLLAALCFVPTRAAFGARKVGLYRYSTIQEQLRVVKRNGPSCSTGSRLCPVSLDGGCCPEDRSCGLTDCPASATASCRASQTHCPLSLGGGCCNTGHTCIKGGCVAPYSELVTNNQCTQYGMTLCPSQFSTLCCGTGYSCGPGTCYPKSITSFPITITTIVTSNGTPFTQVSVVTTALVPVPPPAPSAPTVTKGTAAAPTNTAITTIIKGPTATPTPTPGSGLSKAAIIGLSTGILVCMIAVFIATCMTIRKLRRGPRRKRNRSDSKFNGSPHHSTPDGLQNPISSQTHTGSGILQQPQLQQLQQLQQYQQHQQHQPIGHRIFVDDWSPSQGRSISNGRGGSIDHPTHYHASTDSSSTLPNSPQRNTGNTHELEATPLPHRTSISSGGSGAGVVRTDPQGYGYQHHPHLAGVAEASLTVPEFNVRYR